jgi:hypothetical protein
MEAGRNVFFPFSNIDVVILANRPAFTSEIYGLSRLFGVMEIGTQPIIRHLLEYLEFAGFGNVTLVCLEKDGNAYSDAIVGCAVHLDVHILPVGGAFTTCDIIRRLKTARHVLLWPIDVIGSVDLNVFVDFHLSNKSDITVLVAKPPGELLDRRNSLGPQTMDRSSIRGNRYVVYDESDRTRLLTVLSDQTALEQDLDLSLKEVEREDYTDDEAIEPERDLAHGMTIDSRLLNGFKSLAIDSTHELLYAYVISPACIDYLVGNGEIHSIESELLANLFDLPTSGVCPVKVKLNASIFWATDSWVLSVIDYRALLVANMKSAESRDGKLWPITPRRVEKEAVSREGLPESFRMNPGCIFGVGLSVLGDGVRVSKSVIGKHCKLGKGCSVTNCVLCAHVEIEEDVVLERCWVGPDSKIRAKSKLGQCVVVPSYSGDPVLNANSAIIQVRH